MPVSFFLRILATRMVCILIADLPKRSRTSRTMWVIVFVKPSPYNTPFRPHASDLDTFATPALLPATKG